MESLLDDAFKLLELGTKLEDDDVPIEAATKYYEATYLLKRYIARLPMTPENIQTCQLIEKKVTHYEDLAKALLNQENYDSLNASHKHEQPESPFSKHCQFFDDTSVVPVPAPSLPSPRFEGSSLQPTAVASISEKAARANNKLAYALDVDESGKDKEAAIQAYMEAAEIFLEAIKMVDNAGDGAQSVASLLKRRLAGALDRVEDLKHPTQKTVVREQKVKDQTRQEGSPLSDEEVAVLKHSSLIASGLFLPWSDASAQRISEEAQRPTIATASLWTDPNGYLKLSDKQRARFHKWARPSEICLMRRKQGLTSTLQKPIMVKSITPFTIRQQYVTDCSFIASLCICAAFERRFGRKLVTSLIYPQGPDGLPILNPSGKYQIKLWLNGVAREVIVDDYLPVDKFGNVLCSHTTTKGLELWVCIIEKAYMKLCGGYDFPGSNSGVDLFSLTGWIPERIFFPKDPARVRDFETPSERAWERLCSASSFGDCLITMSTSSDLEEEMANEAGIVTGHAYAVLSVVQTRNGTRLLQLKNPWAYKAWRGRYSCHDLESWNGSPGLCNEVGYNPVLAQQHDDGIFWIEWKDVLVFFQNIHLSWNPGLFSYHTTIHGFWPLKQGPVDDTFNVRENPQYVVKLSDAAIAKKATLWILLSRHVAKQEQEGSEATDYLTVHVHRTNEKRDRINYQGGKSCVLTGAYTNNPHLLVRYDVSGSADDKYLSLVLSQYKKSSDVSYSLSCYSTELFALSQPAKRLPICTTLSGQWTQISAGGPPGTRMFQNNPSWAFRVPSEGALIEISCTTIKTMTVNVMAIEVDTYGKRVTRISREPSIDSGDYRHGFTITKRCRVPGGVYTLVASSFYPGEIGSFRIVIESSLKLKFERIL